jgi:hypothetical protein
MAVNYMEDGTRAAPAPINGFHKSPNCIIGHGDTMVLPDVPAMAETLPGYDLNALQGIVVRAGTPRAIVDRLGRDLREVVAMPDVRARLESEGADVIASTPDQQLWDIKRALRQGLVDMTRARQHWAFQPLPAPPAGRHHAVGGAAPVPVRRRRWSGAGLPLGLRYDRLGAAGYGGSAIRLVLARFVAASAQCLGDASLDVLPVSFPRRRRCRRLLMPGPDGRGVDSFHVSAAGLFWVQSPRAARSAWSRGPAHSSLQSPLRSWQTSWPPGA